MDDPPGSLPLGSGEPITQVQLPPPSPACLQPSENSLQRVSWDFSLIACAAARRTDGSVRMALGGVGLGPWCIAHSVEEDVASGGLDEDSIDALAERAMYDTVPLARNGYKVWMAQAALRRAMRAMGAAG